jgi:predicted permease
MSWLRILATRFRGIFFRRRLDRELEAELRSHLEMAVKNNLRLGMTPEAARHAAEREFGGLQQTKEAYRDGRGLPVIETFVRDVRYGGRMLRRSPALTAVAILSLALGIGANTAIFTIIDAIALKMLPVKDPSALVQLNRYWDGRRTNFSYPDYAQLRDGSHSFDGVFAVSNNQPSKIRIVQEIESADCQYVTGNYYEVLGVTAVIGRVIRSEDDPPSGPPVDPVAVLSYAFWKQRFGADPAVIGRSVLVEKVRFTVVGVTPMEFFGVETGRAPAITIPMASERLIRPESWLPQPDYHWLSVMARLKRGVSREQSHADISVIFKRLVAKQALTFEDPYQRRIALGQTVDVIAGTAGLDTLRLRFSDPLHVLMAMVGLVLLIACANIANLLVARAAARRREIAVRLALGAGRWRLVRQFLTESVLLAMMGGTLGLLLAWWGSNALVVFMSNGQSRILPAMKPDAHVLLFTMAVSILTGVFFGLAPAIRAIRVEAAPALKETRSVSSSNRLGKVLVMYQAALSLVLVAGAVLLARSLQNLETMNPGFDRRNILILDLDTERGDYKGARLNDYYQQLLVRIAHVAGVHSASAALITPISGGGIDLPAHVEGYTPRPDEDKEVYVDLVAPKYFETMGTALLAGRDFAVQDRPGAPKVVMVNQMMARYYFGDANPIGRHVQLANHEPAEIVGVVGDAKYLSLREMTPRTVYLPCFQEDLPWGPAVFVQTSLPTGAMASPLRSVVRSLDPNMTLSSIRTLSEHVEQSLIRERMIALLSSFFGLLALLLASIGLYGVMSYTVVRRTNEIGIRVALGADRRDVLGLVLRETMLPVICGIAIGLPAAVASARLIRDQLFEVGPGDPWTMCIAVVAIAGVAALAGYLPARRAARVDPMIALRYE